MSRSTLPAPPRALAAILEAASDPDVRLDKMTALIAADPSFAGVILGVANRVAYRGSRSDPITDMRQATLRMGVRTLRNYALCHAAVSAANARPLAGFDLGRFWEESLRRAVACELLAQHAQGIDASEAFTIGLLQELGVLGLLLEHPERVTEWPSIRERHGQARLDAEGATFGATHVDVVGHLASDWGLPEELSVPLALHHHPERAPEPLRARCAMAGTAETMAQVLGSADPRGAISRARVAVAALLGDQHDFAGLMGDLGRGVREAAPPLGIRVGEQASFDDIMAAANTSLVNMNLSYEDLVQRLETVIEEKENLAKELDRRNAELERMATTDALTELPNRRELFRRLQLELTRVQRHGGNVAMVVADIDHFKRVNDTWGHVFGDEVLKRVATAMAACARTNDLVARTGGEEFGALLPATDPAGAATFAQRILQTVSALALTSPRGESVKVTISVGIAWMSDSHRGAVNIDDATTRLYNAADEALYFSKQNGRNRATRKTHAVPWDTQVRAPAA